MGGKGHCPVRSSISSLLILRTRDTSVKRDTSVSDSELKGKSDRHNKALKKNDNVDISGDMELLDISAVLIPQGS